MQNFNNGRFGRFVPEEPAVYEINSLSMEASWEYIYQNRDILLRVDQFGPVSVQAHPPGDIMLLKREKDDKFSKWLVWMKSDTLNGGMPFTNFCMPDPGGMPHREPKNLCIRFTPYEAVYSWEMGDLCIATRFFVPDCGTDIHMSLELKNLGTDPIALRVMPSLAPYVNPAQLAPWDKPEWYLKTGFGLEREGIFWTRLFNAGSDAQKRRTATLWTSREDICGYEVSLEKFMGAGDWCVPQAAFSDNIRLTPNTCGGYGSYTGENEVCGYPPVWAVQYDWALEPGEKRQLQQVLSMPAENSNHTLQTLAHVSKPLAFFDHLYMEAQRDTRRRFFDRLFAQRRLKTEDPNLDNYVNYWLPLQMYWVASLDRGWPTGMRGTRDCANDFMGQLPLDPAWAREMLLLLFSCQRSDGWFPRQISVHGRDGRHDLRPFVDGGAFVLEFLNEYICYTGDTALLEESLPWLDTEQRGTLWNHAVRAAAYYIDPDNLGEHGLCKIRGGDWLDAVNRAGLEGRGESVMVTCQAVMAIDWLCALAQYVEKQEFSVTHWRERQESLRKAVHENALNSQGFYNGVFTDAGQWIFSDRDPDGACRPYVCANAYAVLSGIAPPEAAVTALDAAAAGKGRWGYRLFYPPIGKAPIEKIGRAGSGDGPPGLFENATPYNHGSHGFLGRAMASAGRPEDLLDVLYYMLPFDQQRHPTEAALTPPYAMVNCWQEVNPFQGRGGMLFLTGSTAMALRLVYNWMLGICFLPDALELAPCCAAELGTVNAQFAVRGQCVTLTIQPGGQDLWINGALFIQGKPGATRQHYRIPYKKLAANAVLEIQKTKGKTKEDLL